MHHSILPFFGSIGPLFIPIVALLIPIVIVPVSMYFQHQRRKLWHDTARLALEKGQPIPPEAEMAQNADRRLPRPARDLRTGLILIAVSIGLYFGSDDIPGLEHSGHSFFIGAAIPGCIGLALLLNALITVLFVKNPDSLPNSPSDRVTKP